MIILTPTDVLLWADWIGTVAFALSGVLIGVRHQLDLVGIFVLGILTASGGGMLRDVLIGVTPDIFLNPKSFYVVITVILFIGIFKIHRYSNLERRTWFVVSDTLGLIAFSITGAFVAMSAGLHFFGVLVIGFITATGGGVLRDLLVNQVPFILKGGFHGSFSMLTAAMLYMLHSFGLDSDEVVVFIFLVMVVLRLKIYTTGWTMPVIK